MSIFIPRNDSGVTISYLQRNYTSKNLLNAQLATKINLTGTNALSGDIIPSTTNTRDLGDTSHRYSDIYSTNIDSTNATITNLISTNLTTNSITATNNLNKIILSGQDLGLTLDGITDDSSTLQTVLNSYSDVGLAVTVVINSQFGMAIYSIVTIGSNINLIINCPVFVYGDGGFRTFGDNILGDNFRLAVGESKSTSDNTLIMLNSADVATLTVNDVVKIRGRSDANGNAYESETNIITGISGLTLTFKNNFQHSYKDIYTDVPYTDRTYVVKIQNAYADSVNPTRGSTTITVNDASIFQVGQMVTLNDYALVLTDYPGNTSNNTYRNDVNRITGVNTGTNILTLEKPLVMDYNVTTNRLYVTPVLETRNTVLENIKIQHKKYPTNRNRHVFTLNTSQKCLIKNCSILNKIRNDTIIVNSVTGNVFSIYEAVTGVYNQLVSYTIPYGIYKIKDLCDLLATGLTSSSSLGVNVWTYLCSYNPSNGKITLVTSVNTHFFKIPYVAGRATPLFGFVPDIAYDSIYTGTYTYTGESVHLSGAFKLPLTNTKFYFTESVGSVAKTITFDSTIFYNTSTLIKALSNYMTSNSANGYTYSITFNETTDCLTFSNGSAGNFSIDLTSKTDSIYQYIGLHDAKGKIISTLSGANTYSTATDCDSVAVLLTTTSKGNGFRIESCINCIVDGCYFGPSLHVSSGESYAFTLYRCRANIISNCSAVQARHSVLLQTAHCNTLCNFNCSNARISSIDWHGLNSRDNLIDGVIIGGGIAISPDSTTHSAIKLGNTAHLAGDHYNSVKNIKVTGYANTDSAVTNNIISILPSSSYNIIENLDCDGCDQGINIIDISGKDYAYTIIRNVIRNCFFLNCECPMLVNPHNSGTNTSLTDLLIENCTWSYIGTGSSDESRALIKNTTDCTLRNCTFRNIISGSSDLETLYGISNTNLKLLNCNFVNMKRGVYMDTNSTYTVDNCCFDSLTGSSHVVIKDANTGNTGVWSGNKYLNCTPRTSYTNAGTGSNITWRSLTSRKKLYTSNASSSTTLTSTITLDNNAPSSGGTTVMGTTTLTYSSVEIYGEIYVDGWISYQLPNTIGSNSHVVAQLFYSSDNGSTYTLIGHSIQSYTTSDTDAYRTINILGKLAFTDKLSTSTSKFDLRIGTVSGDSVIICKTFAMKPYFTVQESFLT